MAAVSASDPQRLLARGWSVTHDEEGRLVREAGSVRAGDGLWTTVADGTITSRVAALPNVAQPGTIGTEETTA